MRRYSVDKQRGDVRYLHGVLQRRAVRRYLSLHGEWLYQRWSLCEYPHTRTDFGTSYRRSRGTHIRTNESTDRGAYGLADV